MKLPVDFSDDYPPDTILYAIDFVNDLPPGDTIASAVWQVIVSTGSDPLPASHLNGAAVIVGTEVRQSISNLQSGVLYTMRALVTTQNGNKISLFSHVRAD